MNVVTVSDFLAAIRVLAGSPRHDARHASLRRRSPPWYKDQPNQWFRGHACAGWPILPRVLRPDFVDRSKELEPQMGGDPFWLEAGIFRQFLRRAHSLLPDPGDLTSVYFLAQHHGLPTRLLDWTANPLVGLFFATAGGPHEGTDGEVVVLRSRAEIPGSETWDIRSQDDPDLSRFVGGFLDTSAVFTWLADGPPWTIAPQLQSGRMLQQDARFTMHLPHGETFDHPRYSHVISRLHVPADAKVDIRMELSQLGINVSVRRNGAPAR